MKVKRFLSLLLIFCIVMSCFSVSAAADTEGEAQPPAESEPQTPIEPEPQPPTQPEPQTPTEPEPQTPTEPEPQTPTEPDTQTPTQPDTQTPTEPEPQTPTEPEPQTPTEPEPQTPTEPDTQPPTESEPQTPTEPDTQTPTEPDTQPPTEPDTPSKDKSSGKAELNSSSESLSLEGKFYLKAYSHKYGSNISINPGNVGVFCNDPELKLDRDYTLHRPSGTIHNVGNYDFVIIGLGAYDGLSCTLTYTVNPNVLNPRLSVSPAEFTYDGSAKEPTITLVDNGAKPPFTVSYDDNVNAGTVNFTVYPVDGANYIFEPKSGSFTINPKEVTPVAEYEKNHVYTGKGICPELTLYTDSSKSTVIPASEYSVSYEDNINVGPDAQIVVSDIDGGNYTVNYTSFEFNIQHATPVYTAPTAKKGLKYNGKQQKLVNPGSVTTPNCDIYYSDSKEGALYHDIPKAKDIGSYEVWYTVVSNNSNYKSVGPFKITVKISAYTAGDKVADMIRGLNWLPDGQVDPGNKHQRSQVLKVWKAYNELSDTEKRKVPSELYDWLYYLVSNTDYAIISGSGSYWYEGRKETISIVAIDPQHKFNGLMVNDKLLPATAYSCYWYGENAYGHEDLVVLTLKSSYLQSLKLGSYDITVCYSNGYASGVFYVVDSAASPRTGDPADFALWFGLMGLSITGAAGAFVYSRRRKKN